ncbi:classical arabinogalactan protein 1-like [Trifolium pratense]|uniref:classical arabinogalactan protein 1-like n=1 Tax=Trifolium pratense TaxID=57577 RepID=UPI001E692261|nr:classical arabinogalactan protein 1-like [Trifolium pratense]
MGLFKLFSVMIIAALLLSTTTMAQSLTKSQPPRKAISPSPAAVTQSPASSPSQPSDAAISPSSISAPPSKAPGPASSGVVFNRVSVSAGSAAIVVFAAVFIM